MADKKPVSLPVIPPAPTSSPASPDSLRLFQPYVGVQNPDGTTVTARQAYRAKNGVDPDPFDPSDNIRSYFDSSASPGPYLIPGILPNGTPGMVSTPTPAKVCKVNLPNDSSVVFPKFVPNSSSPGVIQQPGTQTVDQLDPVKFCTDDQVKALVDSLKGSGIKASPVDQTQTAFAPAVVILNAGETRKAWGLIIDGEPFPAPGKAMMAGPLLGRMYAVGVGAPMAWTLKGDVLDCTPMQIDYSELKVDPVPCAPPPAGWELQQGMFGLSLVKDPAPSETEMIIALSGQVAALQNQIAAIAAKLGL